MKIPRALAVFFCSAVAILSVALLKALVVSGLDKLPPVKARLFASSTFGLLAALIDWALLRNLFPGGKSEPSARVVPAVERVRLRPIVFKEICPPPASKGLSFYGGAPIGPATLDWPREREGTPLSFIMQWDAAELARQDASGLLPRDGVLYLFADLNWGDPFAFRFVHAAGPVQGWQALSVATGAIEPKFNRP